MRPGTRAARMRWRVSSSSMTPLTRTVRTSGPRVTAAVWTPVTAAWAGVRVTRLGSTAWSAAGPLLAATRAMPQMVHLASAWSDLIHGCIGHW